MTIGRAVYDHLLREIGQAAPHVDLRRLRTLAWMVAGAVLEQDARLSLMALAMDDPQMMPARLRRIGRLLDGPLDSAACYQALVRPHLEAWDGRKAWLVLDTSSIRGDVFFARVGLLHRRTALPLAWKVLDGDGATVGFDGYRPLLERVGRMLPPGAQCVLLADCGFDHAALLEWCLERGWGFRLCARRSVVFSTAGGRRKCARDYSTHIGTGTVWMYRDVHVGVQEIGPVGLVMSWPRHGRSDCLHVVSHDAPTHRTLPDYRLQGRIDHGFRTDKSAGFQLESTRLRKAERVDRLLLTLAIATLELVSMGDRLVRGRLRQLVDGHHERGLSYFQLGCRAVRRRVLAGQVPDLGIELRPRPIWPPGRAGVERIRMVYENLGLRYGGEKLTPGTSRFTGFVWLRIRKPDAESD